MTDTATEIMFSYLVFIGFIIFITTLTGQSLFGSDFPENPFISQSFQFENTCAEEDWACNAGLFFGQSLQMLALPFLYLAYLWAIFVFFMTSPTLWWLGTLLFIPAGIVFFVLIEPVIEKIIEFLIRLFHAIAELIPF